MTTEYLSETQKMGREKAQELIPVLLIHSEKIRTLRAKLRVAHSTYIDLLFSPAMLCWLVLIGYINWGENGNPVLVLLLWSLLPLAILFSDSIMWKWKRKPISAEFEVTRPDLEELDRRASAILENMDLDMTTQTALRLAFLEFDHLLRETKKDLGIS